MEEIELVPNNIRKPTRLLVIGGSAGSLTMILQIVPALTLEMNVCVLIVVHRKSNLEDNVLIEVLKSRTKFDVREVEDKDDLQSGSIFIAPADYHVLIEKHGSFTLDASEKVHFSRPSIDVTFESVAEAYGKNAVCVLLSGANADGAAGLQIAQQLGAITVVQDPTCADVPYMPQEALAIMKPDVLLDEKKVSELMRLLK